VMRWALIGLIIEDQQDSSSKTPRPPPHYSRCF
jgi:hypothetical protein